MRARNKTKSNACRVLGLTSWLALSCLLLWSFYPSLGVGRTTAAAAAAAADAVVVCMQPPLPLPSAQQTVSMDAAVHLQSLPAFHKLLPLSPVIPISKDSCPSINKKQHNFLHHVLLPSLQSGKRISPQAFVCAANCSLLEPELEFSAKYLGNPKRRNRILVGNLINLCARGRVPLLIRILPNGDAQWTKCETGEKLKATHHLFAVLRQVYILSKLIDFGSKGVVFALDTSDYSRPEANDPHGLSWMYTEPGIVRFVGDATHPALLWPTLPYVRQTAYCSFDEDESGSNGDGSLTWLTKTGPCWERDVAPKWSELKDQVFWRGSATGFPIDDLHVEFMPRSILNRGFSNRPGFDVAFVEDAVPPYANRHFKASHLWLPRVSRHKFREYKMIISLDGHTASWGLIERFGTGNLLLAVESLRQYREFYYVLLQPWQHYLPIAFDLSNLEAVRGWVLTEGERAAEEIAASARVLVQQRMRAEDLWCYLYRMLATLAQSMDFQATDAQFHSLKWNDITRDTVSSYRNTFVKV